MSAGCSTPLVPRSTSSPSSTGCEPRKSWKFETCRSQSLAEGSHYQNLLTTSRSCALSATAGILSALALLLIKETVFLLSEYRQASEQQELAHKSTCTIVICREPEFAFLDFEFPFLCGFGHGRICCACSRGDPSVLVLFVLNWQPSESVVSA